jgi:6-phosphogluconate dehydrogenase
MSYGVIGLGSMGSNLAINISKKHKLHLYNRTTSIIEKTINQGTPGRMKGHQTVLQMTHAMEIPRTIINMLPHGEPSTTMMKHTVNLLDPGDTIIDCANEHYTHSVEREKLCDKHCVNYLGTGMSGGTNGALYGPAVMIGGRKSVYDAQKDYLNSFCNSVVHVGEKPDSGHFTKMVHNGIEYSMLQAIADVYAYLNYDYDSMTKILRRCCNRDSELNGYLAQCAFQVLDNYDIGDISDVAPINDTVLWCVNYAYKHSINVPTMHSAIQARLASTVPKNNVWYQRSNTKVNLDAAYQALRLVFAMAVNEGISLIEHKSIASINAKDAWSTSSIIECLMLNKNKTELDCITNESIHKARILLTECVRSGVPVPSISAAVQHHDFTHQPVTQMNFLMAQRNYYGQHP